MKEIKTIKSVFCVKIKIIKKKDGGKKFAFLRKLKYSGNVLFTDS